MITGRVSGILASLVIFLAFIGNGSCQCTDDCEVSGIVEGLALAAMKFLSSIVAILQLDELKGVAVSAILYDLGVCDINMVKDGLETTIINLAPTFLPIIGGTIQGVKDKLTFCHKTSNTTAVQSTALALLEAVVDPTIHSTTDVAELLQEIIKLISIFLQEWYSQDDNEFILFKIFYLLKNLLSSEACEFVPTLGIIAKTLLSFVTIIPNIMFGIASGIVTKFMFMSIQHMWEWIKCLL